MLQKIKKIRKLKKQKKRVTPIETISKYFNPHNSFQVSDIFLDQNALKNPSNQSMFTVFFAFNRITKSIQRDGYIQFQLKSNITPVNPQYVIERFKSFNSQYFYKLAEGLQKLTQLQKNAFNIQMISIQKILNKIKNTSFFMSCCHFNSHTQVNFVRSFVSNNFLKQLGFDSQAIQLEGVKYGTMLSGYIENGGYKQAILSFIWALILFYKNMLMENKLIEMQKQQIINLRTKQNMLLQAKCKLIFPSPQAKIIQIQNIISSRSIFEGFVDIKQKMKQQIQQQQYEILKYLIKISKNKINANKGLICGYRPIEKQIN